MKAEDLIQIAETLTRQIFSKHDRVTTMYHYVRDDGEHGIFTVPDFCLDKDEFVLLARVIFEVERAICCVLIDEAWVVEYASEDQRRRIEQGASVADQPGRQEIVLIMGEDQDGICRGCMPIIRPKDAKPYLGPIEVSRPENIEGRMVGVLPREHRPSAVN